MSTAAEPIVIGVNVEKCGHNRRLTGDSSWLWISAPPHVQRFVTGSLAAVVAELATLGYTFTVEPREREISMLAWCGATPVEP